MRILLCHPGPEFSVHDVFAGWEKALRKLGHQVMVFNLNHRLSYHGNSYLKDYPEGWEGTRQLSVCPACGQEPFKKALTDDQVKTITTRQIFEDAFAFWPDVVMFVSGFFYEPAIFEVLRARGMTLVMLHTESPYEDRKQMERGQHMDLNLVNDPTNLDEWREFSSAYYMPHAYDPAVHYPEGPFYATQNALGVTAPFPRLYETDFVFIGTGFKSRRDFFGKLDLWGMRRDGLRISIGGGGWGDAAEEPENSHILDFLGHHPEMCVDNTETAEQYRQARVSLNLYRREGEDGQGHAGWSMGPREVELAACGTFFIRDARPEGDELFPGLPVFESPEEAAAMIRFWANSKQDRWREELAREARSKIVNRTFDNNAKQFMKYLEYAGVSV